MKILTLLTEMTCNQGISFTRFVSLLFKDILQIITNGQSPNLTYSVFYKYEEGNENYEPSYYYYPQQYKKTLKQVLTLRNYSTKGSRKRVHKV